jgi:hypothetical protein
MTTKMLVLHAFRVISMIAFAAVAWWLAMYHHDDGDFLTFAMTIIRGCCGCEQRALA